MVNTNSNFDFKTQREQSKIKTILIEKYFLAWARIMIPRSQKIGYIDLFSGPGIYDDGTESTPIIILKNCINDKKLRESIVTIFNDKNPEYANQLAENIKQIQGIESLKHKPIISNREITIKTPEIFSTNLIPCFSFIDPAGYSGLSLDLIHNLTKDFGSDIVFFFNFNEINRAIYNPKVNDRMNDLFGENNLSALKNRLQGIKDSYTKEATIINFFAQLLESIDLKYVLPFRFQFFDRNRTSHYLIFASKNFTGFNIMKEIMWKEGEKDSNNVGKFEFIPSVYKDSHGQLSILDMYSTSLEDLQTDLLNKYRGKTILLQDLYLQHSVNNQYIMKNYKDVLLQMEENKIIICDPADRRKRNGIKTMNPKKVKIMFPS